MPLQSSNLAAEPPAGADAPPGFDHWFKVVPVDSPALLEEAFRLRYQVYCVENDFEDPSENPDGLESDEYDSHSVHSLLLHRPSGMVSGAVRLILPEPGDPHGSLPIGRVCPLDLIQSAGPFDLARCAEISRFAVSKRYRRRLGEERFADTTWGDAAADSEASRRQLPFITLGLLRACLLMSIEQRITHLFAVMEPALIRLIRRFGLSFTPVGPLVDYHGHRQPCFAAIKDLLETSQAHTEQFWNVGTDNGRLRLD